MLQTMQHKGAATHRRATESQPFPGKAHKYSYVRKGRNQPLTRRVKGYRLTQGNGRIPTGAWFTGRI